MTSRRYEMRTRGRLKLVAATVLVFISTFVVGAGVASAATTPNFTLGTSPTSPTYPDSVTLTATIDVVAAGTIDITVNGNEVGCVSQFPTPTSPPSATCLYNPPSAGPYTFGAMFTLLVRPIRRHC